MKEKVFSAKNYIDEHNKVFKKINFDSYNAASELVVNKIKQNKKIITCGNGGSAYTASHFITDWNKMYFIATGNKLRGISLVDNVGLVTAFGNDIDYDSIFSGQLDSLMDKDDLIVFANKVRLKIEKNMNYGQLLDIIFGTLTEPKLIQPTFVTHYPTSVSPLARSLEDNADLCERFELFIAGREIANGFSELNDPEEQAIRFKNQVGEQDELMKYDEDFIKALEYGMPPTAGAGIGIDRLVMLLTDTPSIRDFNWRRDRYSRDSAFYSRRINRWCSINPNKTYPSSD